MLSSSPALVTITEGDSLNLSCAVTGTPRPSIDWLFNGALTLNNQMSRVIPLVGEHHHGMHECFAENDYGTIHSSTFVNVECNVIIVNVLMFVYVNFCNSHSKKYISFWSAVLQNLEWRVIIMLHPPNKHFRSKSNPLTLYDFPYLYQRQTNTTSTAIIE